MASTTTSSVEGRVLVIKPFFRKTTTTTTTLKTLSTSTTSTTTTSTIYSRSTTPPDVVPSERVLVPVIPQTKPPPTIGRNSTLDPHEGYGLCAPFPACNPMGCGDPTVAPIDCPGCSRAATGGTMFGMILLSLLIVIANFLVIRIILRTPSLRRRHGYIKLSMATSDLLIGLFVIPSAIGNLVMTLYYPYRDPGDDVTEPVDWIQQLLDISQRNSIGSIIFGTIAVISVTSSLYNLLLLSLDRFLAIARPLKHRAGRYFPKKSLWISLAAVWIFGVTLSIVPAFFPKYFTYGMDPTTFVYVQFVTSVDVYEGGSYGFSPYYVTIIIGGPYFVTVILNILTTAFTWKSLRVRSRMSTRRTMDRSAVEKKCERNRRIQMLRKAYPEEMEEAGSSTFQSVYKKGTPRHEKPKKKRRHQNGATSSGGQKTKDNWLVWWHSDDNIANENENSSNNVSTDSEEKSQSPRFQRTRDHLHIVRDALTPSNVRNKAREFKANHRTHVRVLKMIIAMIVSFTVCLMPYVIVSAKLSNGSLDCSNVAVPFTFALYMLFINSGANFVIYNLCHPEFRHHLKKTFISDYSKTNNWRRAASELFMTSQKSTDSSMTYMTRAATSTDVVAN